MERNNKPKQAIDQARKLEKFTEDKWLQFIESELTLGFTFSNLAETELRMGHAARARELMHKARTAADTAFERLHQQEVPEAESAKMHEQVEQLRSRLTEVEQKIA